MMILRVIPVITATPASPFNAIYSGAKGRFSLFAMRLSLVTTVKNG